MMEYGPERPRIDLGQLVITERVVAEVGLRAVVEAIERHQGGDWGEVGEEDAAANDDALAGGGPLLSVFHLPPADGGEKVVRVYVVGESGQTSVLLPEEY